MNNERINQFVATLRAEMVFFYTEVSVEIKLHPSGGYQVCD